MGWGHSEWRKSAQGWPVAGGVHFLFFGRKKPLPYPTLPHPQLWATLINTDLHGGEKQKKDQVKDRCGKQSPPVALLG